MLSLTHCHPEAEWEVREARFSRSRRTPWTGALPAPCRVVSYLCFAFRYPWVPAPATVFLELLHLLLWLPQKPHFHKCANNCSRPSNPRCKPSSKHTRIWHRVCFYPL